MSFGGRGGGLLGAAYGTIDLDPRRAQQALDTVARSLQSLAAPSAAANRALEGVQRSLDNVNRGMAAAAKAVGAAAVGLGVEKLGRSVVSATADLETSVKNVQSIAEGLDFKKTFSALTELSTRVPETAKSLGDGLYNIFSSVEVSFDGALTLLDQFARGAAAAQTNSQAFGTAILGVLNAYKRGVEEAQHIQDVFFNTVKFGVVTGAELAQNLGVVTASAKVAGVTIEELGAAIAGVTREGGPAAQNINNLANLFNKIVTADAVKELRALGVATSDAEGKIRPIFDVMGDLRTALTNVKSEAQRAQILQKIFPDAQARQGAVVLMSQLDNIRKFLKANQTEAGSAQRAYETMTTSFAAAATILKNTWTALLTDLGQVILPTMTRGVQALTAVLQGLRATLPDLGTAAGQFFGRMAGSSQDVGKLEGVMARIFGQNSGVVAGLRGFLAVVDRIRETAAGAFRTLAEAIGLTDSPIARFLSGIGEIARALGARLFPAQLDEEVQVLGQGMERLRESAERNRSPLERFAVALGEIARAVRASPEIQRLGDALGRLGDAGRRAWEALAQLVGVLVRPFTRSGAASDVAALSDAYERLAPRATDAERALTTIRGAIDGLSGIIGGVAGAVGSIATALETIGKQVAASKAVDGLRVALEAAGQAAAPLLATLGKIAQALATGFAPRKAAIPDTGEAFDTVARAAQDASAANAAAAVLITTIEALAKAAAAFAEAMTTLDRQLALLDTRLRETGGGQQFTAELDALGAAVARLGVAPFSGIQRSFEDLSRSFTEATGITAAVGALDVLRGAITIIRLQFEAFAEVIERTTFFLGKHLAALTRLAQGDVAGAVAELASAMQAFRVVEGPPLEANKVIDGPSFDRMRDQINKTGTDISNKLQEIGNWAFPALVPPKVDIPVTADTRQALDQLDQVSRHIAGLPKTASVTVYADISPAAGRLTELARMLPHSPAETGPLAFEPDWSYLTANLPDVLNDMIRLVEDVGERIGGKAQIERFQAIAGAISAAAGAISATVEGLRAAATFVRPAAEVLTDLQDTLADVLGRVRALSGALTKEQAEKIQAVAGAATSAMGALGATVEAMTRVRDFTGPAIAQVQDAVDHIAGLLFRLRDLGQGLTAGEIARVGAIGTAAQAAMGGLAAALDPLTKLRSFTGPAIGQVQDAIDHISGVLVRLSELGLAFTGAQVEQAQALGEAVRAAMGGLNEAVTALTAVRSFRGFDPGLLEDLFALLSNVAVRFRDLSLAFSGRQVAEAQATAEAVRTSFEALAAAVEVLPKLTEASLPDTGQAIAAFARAIELAMQRIVEIAGRLGPEAVRAAGELAESAGRVVDLLGASADAFARLDEVPEVTEGQMARFAAGVRATVLAVAQLAREIGPALTKEALAFSEGVGKALGVLSAVGSLKELADFRAPGRRQIDSFFAVLRVTVDLLVAEAQRIAPEIARRTGQVGADLGKALGGLGTAISAFSALTQFAPGKRFSAQLDGLFAFIEQAIVRMSGLGARLGDPKALLGVATAIEAIGRALASFLSAATGAREVGDLRQLLALVDRLAAAGQTTILGRTEHVIRFEGGFTIRGEGFGESNQGVATASAATIEREIAERLKDEVVGEALAAVAAAIRQAPRLAGVG